MNDENNIYATLQQYEFLLNEHIFGIQRCQVIFFSRIDILVFIWIINNYRIL
ncbi:hypothetical protein DSUL_50398 [Desulfovibrionales bacterium]